MKEKECVERKEYADAKKTAWAAYEVLKNHSSWDHPLSQKRVKELMEQEYGMEVNRNTVKETLDKLRDFYGDSVICCSETERAKSDGERELYKYGYFFDRDAAEDILSDEELEKLLDICLYARNLNAREAKNLIKKLKKMATAECQKQMDYTEEIPEKQFDINPKTSENLQLLRKTISQNRGKRQQWIRFCFNYFSSNQEKNLTAYRPYTVLPLAICEANHKYYLLCVTDGHYGKIGHYRIDLMTRIQSVEHERIEETEEVKKSIGTMDISDYMSSHLYMFYGEPRQIDLEILKDADTGDANLTFLADEFGAGARWRVKSETDEAVVVGIQCVPDAMKILLMKYAGKGIRVVGPEDVRKEINGKIRRDCEKLLGRIDV